MQVYKIHNKGPWKMMRLGFAIVGTVFFAIGLLATYKTIISVLRLSLGTPVEGSLLLGACVSIFFSGLGAFGLWGAMRPDVSVVLNKQTGIAHTERAYPLGLTRVHDFPFDEISPPVLRQKHSDGGKWDHWVLGTASAGRTKGTPKWSRPRPKRQRKQSWKKCGFT